MIAFNASAKTDVLVIFLGRLVSYNFSTKVPKPHECPIQSRIHELHIKVLDIPSLVGIMQTVELASQPVKRKRVYEDNHEVIKMCIISDMITFYISS